MTEPWFNTLGQDIRYGMRGLAKNRGFTVMAILTLALGIGSSTALFSVIENVLIEPFPYTDPGRLMSLQIVDTERSEPGGRAAFTGPELLDYMEQNQAFDRAIASSPIDVLYTTGEGTERFEGYLVTPGTYEFFGMPALLGRVMVPADYEAGAPPVFVLRYKTWIARFSADPGILNRSYVLNGVSRTLVGIMPPRFAWGDADLWIPETPRRGVDTARGAFPRFWFFLGHLKPGLSIREAEAGLDVVARRLAAVYPKDYPKQFKVRLETLADLVVGRFRTTLFVVLAAVGLLLLIGCGNVANLLLARATAREKEFAVRAALGASRLRIVRQLLVESLLLALAAAAVGAFLSWAGLQALVAVVPPDIIPAEAVIRLNTVVLLFTLAVAVATALVFGLVPALFVARRDINEPLRDSGKGTTGGFRRGRLRDAVVVLEVALSLTLLVGAGLLMRSFVALREVKLGFDPGHVLVARLPLPQERYQTAEQVVGFYRPLLARLKALPGVVDATETSTLPPFGGVRSDVEVAGRTHSEKWTAIFQLLSEGYPSVLRVSFVQGRGFTEAEVADARKVAVVNQTFASKYLDPQSPLGQRVHIAQLLEFGDKVEDPWFEVIGVVGDSKNQGLQDAPLPEVWVPYTVTGLRRAGHPRPHRSGPGGASGRRAQGDLGHRPQRGRHPHGHARRLHREVRARGTPLRVRDDEPLRGDRARARGDRRLQRDRLHDRAPDPGDRHPHGPRRRPQGRPRDDREDGSAARGPRRPGRRSSPASASRAPSPASSSASPPTIRRRSSAWPSCSWSSASSPAGSRRGGPPGWIPSSPSATSRRQGREPDGLKPLDRAAPYLSATVPT